MDGYPADNYSRWAEEFIRGKNRSPEKPWFLWLCYGSVHGPSKPAERHRGMYAKAPVPEPSDLFPPRPGKPGYLRLTQAFQRDADGVAVAGKSGESFGDESGKKRQTHADFVRQMNECVPAVDEGVGRLMAALRESGQLENTLVIYSADQGFGMGEHGFRTKLAPYDATYRSPLIISKPGLTTAGGVCRVPVNAPDLVATFLAQAGVAVSWETHGRDMSALLRNPQAAWPHPCLYEYTGDVFGGRVAEKILRQPSRAEHHNVPWYTAVVQNNWKLIHYLQPDVGDELYNLGADPEELDNRIDHPDASGRLAEMRSAMQAELERSKAGFH